MRVGMFVVHFVGVVCSLRSRWGFVGGGETCSAVCDGTLLTFGCIAHESTFAQSTFQRLCMLLPVLQSTIFTFQTPELSDAPESPRAVAARAAFHSFVCHAFAMISFDRELNMFWSVTDALAVTTIETTLQQCHRVCSKHSLELRPPKCTLIRCCVVCALVA